MERKETESFGTFRHETEAGGTARRRRVRHTKLCGVLTYDIQRLRKWRRGHRERGDGARRPAGCQGRRPWRGTQRASIDRGGTTGDYPNMDAYYMLFMEFASRLLGDKQLAASMRPSFELMAAASLTRPLNVTDWLSFYSTECEGETCLD